MGTDDIQCLILIRGADFHTYGVQVDPDPVSPDKHAIISYLLDGKVTNTFKTIDYDDRYNTFITKAIAEGREKRTWDIAITGQIGGKNENGIGYPEDRNANLRNVSMDVDWVRVFTGMKQNQRFLKSRNIPSRSLIIPVLW